MIRAAKVSIDRHGQFQSKAIPEMGQVPLDMADERLLAGLQENRKFRSPFHLRKLVQSIGGPEKKLFEAGSSLDFPAQRWGTKAKFRPIGR
ncbi:MAG: hypothetical protein DWQ01_16260 [Planctomycetota bacterium]|nr:MAG: hypothetical protein DWQ01_16260 [Planctomycetota bacterium]